MLESRDSLRVVLDPFSSIADGVGGKATRCARLLAVQTSDPMLEILAQMQGETLLEFDQAGSVISAALLAGEFLLPFSESDC